MEIAGIIASQTFVMLLLMTVGYCLYRSGKINAAVSRGIGTMLLWVVFPAVIIKSFCAARTPEHTLALVQSTLLGAAALALAMLAARLLFSKNAIEDFAAAFSNAGFIGIPLVQATLGADAVFYIVPFVALLNILQFSYGVDLMTGKKRPFTLHTVLANPIADGTLIGLAIYFSGLGSHLPEAAAKALTHIGNLNAPLAMIVLGVYLAQSDLRALFTSLRLYWVSFVRLVLIPVLTLLLFRLIPVPVEMRLAVLIAAAAPVGANVAVYAQLNSLDHVYASQTVTLSTLLSILILPLFSAAANLIL